jgi:hypothetical protein
MPKDPMHQGKTCLEISLNRFSFFNNWKIAHPSYYGSNISGTKNSAIFEMWTIG